MRRSVLVLLVLPFLALASPPAKAQDRACTQLQHWITDNRGSLPKTYDELLSYPQPYRPSIFAALPATDKVRLLENRYKNYMDEHPDLTPDQKRVLLDALSLISRPGFFTVPAGDVRWEATVHQPILEFEKKALSSFTREDFNALFTRLGGDDQRQLPRGFKTLTGLIDPTAAASPICTCSSVSDWCSSGTHCGAGGCALTTGCGTFYQYTCNGLCYFN